MGESSEEFSLPNPMIKTQDKKPETAQRRSVAEPAFTIALTGASVSRRKSLRWARSKATAVKFIEINRCVCPCVQTGRARHFR
jgi:hypothetical protein